MIGFIGLGAAGGNIVDEAVKVGFRGIVMNYSQQDLDSLENVEEVVKFKGSEGVGKNRNLAIELMEKNWKKAIEVTKEYFSGTDEEVIFVCFATSGGSGSGIGPILIDLLINQMPDKTFVAVPIIPDESEVLINQTNCSYASEELAQLDILVLPIDNQQAKNNLGNTGKDNVFELTNKTFIQHLKEITSYLEKESKIGVLDKKDFSTIMNTKGIGLIVSADLSKLDNGKSNLSETGIATTIQNAWKHSIFIPPQFEKVEAAGFIFNGQQNVMKNIDFKKIFEPFTAGEPNHLFEGYFQDEETGKMYLILAGLPWYAERLNKVESIAKEKQKMGEQIKEKEVYKSGIKLAKKRKETSQKKAVTDIFKQYKNR